MWGADVGLADVLFEFGLVHELGGLGASAAADEGAAGGVKFVGEILEGEQAGGVDGGHVAETEDDHRRQVVKVVSNVGKRVGRAATAAKNAAATGILELQRI